MSWLHLAWAHLRYKPLGTVVNALLMALGTASIVLLLLAGEQFAKLVARDAQGIDLVVGAKGSPLQLILSSVYHADIPTGNIALREAQVWADDARVERAIPLALGDSFQNFRIVGTTPDYAALYQAELDHGAFWQTPLQAVLGAGVARETGLEVGDAFSGAHGLADGGREHAERPYRVVGVLAASGSVLDRLILTDVSSVWMLHAEHQHAEAADESVADSHALDEDGHDHDHGDEVRHADHRVQEEEAHAHADHQITALLLRYRSPMAALSLPRQINGSSGLQAAAPAQELTRLLSLIGLGPDALRAFAAVLLLTAGFSIFAALYGALETRRADLALLRCLGASRGQLMLSLLLEGLLLGALGVALGFASGHGVMAMLSAWLEGSRGVQLDAWVWLTEETLLLLGLLGLGLLAAALPAWRAYRQDVASVLAER